MRWRREPIQVVHRDGVPEQFLRGGRRYLVRTVLDCWVETARWWSGGASVALLTGEAAPVGTLDGERRFWRVEAAAGYGAPVGVYDLCADPDTGGWALARVLD